jgi:two-component system, cell cycle sensor histidine kinase and response regulator CckA
MEPARANASGTILVVDDNADVRTVVVAQLRSLGFAVVEAGDAIAALKIINDGEPIDLLFTDVVMPGGMTGLELGRQAQTIRSGLKVLYTSGFVEASLQGSEQLAVSQGNMLSKPYRLRELAKKVKSILLPETASD